MHCFAVFTQPRPIATVTEDDAIEAAAKIEGKPWTRKAYASLLKQWGRFCKRRYKIGDFAADVVGPPIDDEDNPRQDAWTNAKLAAFFKQPEVSDPERIKRRPEIYFLILTLILHGRRRSEFVYTRKADVVQDEESGVWCLRIVPHARRTLKTRASKKTIPIHQDLLDVGFLEYAAAIEGEWLFPALHVSMTRKGGERKDAGDATSKEMTRLIKRARIYEEGVVPHAWRHNFETACRVAKIPDAASRYIAGRKPLKGDSQAGYGRWPAPTLKDWLDTVKPLPASIKLPSLAPSKPSAKERLRTN